MEKIAIAMGIAAALLAIAAAAAVMAQDQPAGQPAAVAAAEPAPVVAAVPYRYETEYIPDPFEPDRIRRTRTEVSHIVLVRADGTVEIKPAR